MYLPAYKIPFNIMVHISYKIYKRLTDHDQNPCQCADYTIILYNIIFCNHVIYLKLKKHIARIKPLNPYFLVNHLPENTISRVAKTLHTLSPNNKDGTE